MSTSKLTCRERDPKRTLTTLERAQIALEHAPGSPIRFFEFADETGVVRYEAPLLVGEDGPVFLAGTLEVVAGFAQGGGSGCNVVGLEEALEAALAAFVAW